MTRLEIAGKGTFVVVAAAVLGWSGGLWLVQSAIAPQVARAYTARSSLIVVNLGGETFEDMLTRAESVARAAAQQTFDADILVQKVAITVLGDNEGAIAPLLTLEVTRQEWRSFPDAERWAKYYLDSRVLLGFEEADGEGEQP